MSKFNSAPEDPLLRQAHKCLAASEVPPGPSPELIQRVNDQMEKCSPSASRNSSRWTKGRTRYAAIAAAVAVAVGLAIFSLGSGNHVLADVVRQLEDLKSGKARMTRVVDGVKVESTKIFFKGDSLQRTEVSSGDIDVLNLNRGEHIRLMAAEKKVVVEPAYTLPQGETPVGRLKKIASQPLGRIPVRTIDGVENALGFSRKASGSTETIWVDPKTRLPIRGEITFKDADGKTVTTTLDELEYNIDIADSLFEIGTPEDYELVDRRPARVKGTIDLEAIELVLTPNKGLGPVVFGMSREDTVKLFGTPDSTEIEVIKDEEFEQHFEKLLNNPDLADSHEAIRKDIERLKKSAQNRERIEMLKYNSKGFQLNLLPSKGVVGVACYTGGFSFRDFGGRTQEGLKMHDSRERIEQLYGKPDDVQAADKYCQLSYSKLGLTMGLHNDKLTSLVANKGK